MNQELLKHTLKKRRIELTDQEKKDYFPKEPLFMLLFTSAALLFCLLMAKIKGETIEPEFVWTVVLFPVVFAAVGYITYLNKKNTLKLHYISTALPPKSSKKS